jgi:PAS domain S-box-containing protein
MRRHTTAQIPSADSGLAEAKLSLLEFLVSSDDASEAMRYGVQWLATHTSARRALIAIGITDADRLWGVAGTGISPALTGEFSLDLRAQRHPIVTALRRGVPAFFPPGPRQPATPFGGSPFHVIPLRSASAPRALGALLLQAPQMFELDRDVQWFAQVAGEKLARLRGQSVATERGFEHERRLLFGILNAVTDPILLTDTSGKLIIGNTHAERLFAARDDQTEGRRHAVALNNMFLSAALASAAMERTDEPVRELVLVNPDDGSDLLFELLSTPVKDAREGTAIVSVLRDVTDLGRARAELDENYRRLRLADAEMRAERHRLELIMDTVADPIVVAEPSGEIVMMNAPAERLFTVPAGGGIAEQRRVSTNDAHFSSFVSSLLLSGSDERWRSDIALVEPATGRTLPVEAIAGKILSEQNELTAIVTILHDRTEALEKARLYGELKVASEQLEAKVRLATAELAHHNELLRRQALALEQASALKSQFLANMSHEFRTPLNAILGYTNMLLQGTYGDMAAAQRKALGRVDSNSRHLLALINDILDISRIEAGRMPLQLSRFRASDLIAEVVHELEPVIAHSSVRVERRVAPRVPMIRSDRQKVKQILVNLLSNALKFTHEGFIRITCDYEPEEGWIRLTVSDTGIGIDPAHHEQVFEDFRQVDSSPTRAYSGTGLGLSICRRLATMLEGRITLESVVGKGSTFTVLLPVSPREMPETGNEPDAQAGELEGARPAESGRPRGAATLADV